jgi:hypothetical protein
MNALHHNHPETSDRLPPPRPARKRDDVSHSYPADARGFIAESRTIQAGLRATGALGKNWSDAQFVNGFSGLSANAWFQLQAGTYPWPKTPGGSASLARKLAMLVEHGKSWQQQRTTAELRSRVAPTGDRFVAFAEYVELKAAIERAKARVVENIEERLIPVVGESRSGKSMMFRRLYEEKIATCVVSARPSWKRSYFAMLSDLHWQVIGSYPARRDAAMAESALIKYFEAHGGVMEVIELQNICADSLAFMKTLLNDTTIVMVWFMTPKNFERLCYADGSDLDDRKQILGRCTEIIRIRGESAASVRAICPALWGGVADADERLEMIVTEANRGGFKSLIRTVSRSLSSFSGGRVPSVSEVRAALSAYRRQVPVADLSRRPLPAHKAA